MSTVIKSRPNKWGVLGSLLAIAVVGTLVFFAGVKTYRLSIDGKNIYDNVVVTINTSEESLEEIEVSINDLTIEASDLQVELENYILDIYGYVTVLIDDYDKLDNELNPPAGEQTDTDELKKLLIEMDTTIKQLEVSIDEYSKIEQTLITIEQQLVTLSDQAIDLTNYIIDQSGELGSQSLEIILWGLGLFFIYLFAIFAFIFQFFYLTTYRWKIFIGITSLFMGVIPGILILSSKPSEKYLNSFSGKKDKLESLIE